jgi:hypothetical protein
LRFFNQWPFFEEKALFEEFFKATSSLLANLGWYSELEWVRQRGLTLCKALTFPIARQHFFRWLEKILQPPSRIKEASNPLAKIQLVKLEQALGQSFDYIIFCGLNHDFWPPQRQASNALPQSQIQQFNQNAIKMGSQGQGHLIVDHGKGLLIGPAEKNARFFEAFTRLIGKVKCGFSVTASVGNFNHCAATVSEFLLKLYSIDRGFLLDEASLKALIKETHDWLQPAFAFFLQSKAKNKNFPAISTTLQAYQTRRDPEHSFGEFELSYREPPRKGLQLSCKAWESVLKHPALVWFDSVIKVKKAPSYVEAPSWPLIIGTWVHQWLQIRNNKGLQKNAQWIASTMNQAQELRNSVAQSYKGVDRELPDWWTAYWAQAEAMARSFAKILDEVSGFPYAVSELRLPQGTQAWMSKTTRLPLSGCIDLVLAGNHLSIEELNTFLAESVPLWIIDFKTGEDKPLSPLLIKQGKGVQLALYALALHGLGCSHISVSLLGPNMSSLSQVTLKELLELKELWKSLVVMQKSGVIGMCGPLRDNYSFVGNYPMATLPINEEILACKWQLAYPSLPIPQGKHQ